MASIEAASGASVLLAFRAENVRSFRDSVEVSMLATSLAEQIYVRRVAWRESGRPIGVLPVAGIFGANATGKSNVLRAMYDMRLHVLQSFRFGNPTGGVNRRPYLLDPATRSQPSRFEVDIVLNGVRHEYGFILDDSRIVEEWAYRHPHGRPALLFHRRGDVVDLGSVERAKGRAIVELLRPNALFLSTAASANHATLLPLYAWFERNLVLAEAGSRQFRQALTAQLLEDPGSRDRVLTFLRAADLGVTGAQQIEPDPVTRERMQRAVRIILGQEEESEPAVDGVASFGVMLTHRGADADVAMNADDESLGTLVWFGLAGPVLTAIADGSVLLADELDASLHPALVAELIRLFQDPGTNPRRAQLIFNSHDAALLGDPGTASPLGRDQVWFTEKRDDGSSRLYGLSDLAPRKEEAIGRRYLAGRYGGVPILSRQQFADAVRPVVTEHG